MTSLIVGLYIMIEDGDELAEGGVCSSARTIGDEKYVSIGVGAVSHMLGNVTTSPRMRSSEPELAGRLGGGKGWVVGVMPRIS